MFWLSQIPILDKKLTNSKSAIAYNFFKVIDKHMLFFIAGNISHKFSNNPYRQSKLDCPHTDVYYLAFPVT